MKYFILFNHFFGTREQHALKKDNAKDINRANIYDNIVRNAT